MKRPQPKRAGIFAVWLQRRADRNRLRAFDRGFEWACLQVIDGCNPDELRQIVNEHPEVAFAAGANRVLSTVEEAMRVYAKTTGSKLA